MFKPELQRPILRAFNPPWYEGVNFLLADEGQEIGKLYVVSRFIMEEVKPLEAHKESFHLSRTKAQELIDSLWQCGLRPTEGTGSAGSLRATQNHLKDMQRIAFHLLKDEDAKKNI